MSAPEAAVFSGGFAAAGVPDVDTDTCWRAYPHGCIIPAHVLALRLVPKWKFPHNDSCEKCGRIGELLVCDFCNLSFHLRCFQPRLHDVPLGKWACPECSMQWAQLLRTRGMELTMGEHAVAPTTKRENVEQRPASADTHARVEDARERERALVRSHKRRREAADERSDRHAHDDSHEALHGTDAGTRKAARATEERLAEPPAPKHERSAPAQHVAQRAAQPPLYADPSRRVMPSMPKALLDAAAKAPSADGAVARRAIDIPEPLDGAASAPSAQERFEQALRQRVRERPVEPTPPLPTSSAVRPVSSHNVRVQPSNTPRVAGSLVASLLSGLDISHARSAGPSSRDSSFNKQVAASQSVHAAVTQVASAPLPAVHALGDVLDADSALARSTPAAAVTGADVHALPAAELPTPTAPTIDPRRKLDAVAALLQQHHAIAASASCEDKNSHAHPSRDDAPVFAPTAGIQQEPLPSALSAPSAATAQVVMDVARDPRRARFA